LILKVDGDLLEIELNEGIQRSSVRVLDGGGIRLVMHPSTSIHHALAELSPELLDAICSQMTSLFEERGVSREFISTVDGDKSQLLIHFKSH
jgi:predicted metalloprotease